MPPDSNSPDPRSFQPVFGGLLPQQIEALKKPIFEGDVALHPHHKWPYVKGSTVLIKLSRIFGFDGWSTENIRYSVEDKSTYMGKDAKSGAEKKMFRSAVVVTLDLVIHTPGGRSFRRVGIGADEKSSANFIDTLDNSLASAQTYAIRNAAISLGHQFGLVVQRMKLVDAQNRPVDWRKLCSSEPTKLPDLVLLSKILSGKTYLEDGRRFDPSTGIVDGPADPEGDAYDGEGEREIDEPEATDRSERPAERSERPAERPADLTAEKPAEKPAETKPEMSPEEKATREMEARKQALLEECRGFGLSGQEVDEATAAVVLERTGFGGVTIRQFINGMQPIPAHVETLSMIRDRLKKIAEARRSNAAGGPGGPIDRKAHIDEIRKLWQRVPDRATGQAVWEKCCAANGAAGMKPMMVAKPINEGGPTDALLVAQLAAFRAVHPPEVVREVQAEIAAAKKAG